MPRKAKATDVPLQSSGEQTGASAFEGDTRFINRGTALLNYHYDTMVYTYDQGGARTGTRKVQKGNVSLLIPEKVMDYFNIPKYDESSEPADNLDSYTVKAFSYNRWNAIDGTAKQVSVPEHARPKPSRRSANLLDKQAAILFLPDKKTAKGKARTVTINFPPFFNIIMLSQAIGTLLSAAQADRKGQAFRLEGNGRLHVIPYAASKEGPMAGFTSGAWLATAKIANDNGGIDHTIISYGGDQNGAEASPTP